MKNKQKQYRDSVSTGQYVTVSLTLDKELIESIEKTVDNVSQYIEDTITPQLPIKAPVPSRREYNKSPIVKRSFTFTPEFVSRMSKYENRSLAVELLLSKKIK